MGRPRPQSMRRRASAQAFEDRVSSGFASQSAGARFPGVAFVAFCTMGIVALLDGWVAADHVLSGALASCCTLGVFSIFDDTTLGSSKQAQVRRPTLFNTIKTLRQRIRGHGRPGRERRYNKRAPLISSLKSMFPESLPKRHRPAPDADLLILARCVEKLWDDLIFIVFDGLMEQLKKNKCPIARLALLRMANALVGIMDYSGVQYDIDDNINERAEKATLRVLQSPALPIDAREAAFVLLDQLIYEGDSYDKPRVLKACIGAIEHHGESGVSYSAALSTSIMRCMLCSIERDTSSQMIIDHESALSFIFDGIRSGDEKLISASCRMIAFFLYDADSPTDSVTLAVRHYEQLRIAFGVMSMEDIDLAMCGGDEYGGAALTSTPSLVHSIAGKLGQRKWSSPYEEGHVCRIAVHLLDYAALNDDGNLEICLGLGLLRAARRFAHDPTDGEGHWVQPVLVRVLALAPAWTSKLKEWTESGPAGNTVADYGRQLRQRAPRPATTYYLL